MNGGTYLFGIFKDCGSLEEREDGIIEPYRIVLGSPTHLPFRNNAHPAVVALSDWSKVKVPCSSWQYWVLVLAIVPVVVAVTLIARQYLMRKRQLRLVIPPPPPPNSLLMHSEAAESFHRN